MIRVSCAACPLFCLYRVNQNKYRMGIQSAGRNASKLSIVANAGIAENWADHLVLNECGHGLCFLAGIVNHSKAEDVSAIIMSLASHWRT